MGTETPSARRWKGMDPAQRDAQRRRRLLDAALATFGEDGYAASAIEALCSRANVATRSFYELFPSREALLVATYEEIIEEVRAGVASALADGADDVATQVRRGVSAYLVPLVRDERKGRITRLEVVGISGDLEAHRRAAIRGFAAMLDEQLERWMADGRIPRRDRGLLTLVMVGGVSEVLVDYLVTPEPSRRPIDALVDEVTRIWLLVLGATGEPPAQDQRRVEG